MVTVMASSSTPVLLLLLLLLLVPPRVFRAQGIKSWRRPPVGTVTTRPGHPKHHELLQCGIRRHAGSGARLRGAPVRLQLQQARRRPRRRRRRRRRLLPRGWTVRRRRRLHGRLVRLSDLRGRERRSRPPRAGQADPPEGGAELVVLVVRRRPRRRSRRRHQLELRRPLVAVRRPLAAVRRPQLPDEGRRHRPRGHQAGDPGRPVQPDLAPGGRRRRLPERLLRDPVRVLRGALLMTDNRNHHRQPNGASRRRVEHISPNISYHRLPRPTFCHLPTTRVMMHFDDDNNIDVFEHSVITSTTTTTTTTDQREHHALTFFNFLYFCIKLFVGYVKIHLSPYQQVSFQPATPNHFSPIGPVHRNITLERQ